MSKIFKPVFDAALTKIVEDGHKPYVVINAADLDVGLFSNSVNPDGTLVLNFSPNALSYFKHENGWIELHTSVGGHHQSLKFPDHHVLAMYAYETFREAEHHINFIQPNFKRLEKEKVVYPNKNDADEVRIKSAIAKSENVVSLDFVNRTKH